MDPVSGVGIAAATLQFVDFASRLLATGWHVYRNDGESLAMKELSAVSADLNRLVKGIADAIESDKQSMKGGMVPSGENGISDAQFTLLLEQAEEIAADIKTTFPHSFQHQSGSGAIRVKLRGTFEQTIKARDVQSLTERLNRLRDAVMHQLTTSTWLETRNTKAWQKTSDFKLDEILQQLQQTTTTNKFPSLDHLTYLVQANKEQIVQSIWNDNWQLDESALPARTPGETDRIRDQVLRTLGYEGLHAREDAILEAFESTYSWIFAETPLSDPAQEGTRQSLSAWMQSTDEVTENLPFWITGKPGSGKSVMMKYIAGHPMTEKWLSAWAEASQVYQATYYAWRPGDDLGKCCDGLFRSVLHTIVKQCPDLTAKICPRYWALSHLVGTSTTFKHPEWTRKELKVSLDVALALLSERKRKLFLLIDGLDEFTEPPTEIGQLVMKLAQSPVIRTIVASRPWPHFADAFAKSPRTEMHLTTREDMSKFILGKFQENTAFRELNQGYSDGGDLLLSNLLDRAEGVFLWVSLVSNTLLEKLGEGAGLPELEASLDTMPQEMEALYDAIFEALPGLTKPQAAILLLTCQLRDELPWRVLWLVDESNGNPTIGENRPAFWTSDEKQLLPHFLRRINARTRGILQVAPPLRGSAVSHVVFLHRTAAEWADMRRVRDVLKAHAPEEFRPLLSLCAASLYYYYRMRSLDPSDSAEQLDQYRAFEAMACATHLAGRSAENHASAMAWAWKSCHDRFDARADLFGAVYRKHCQAGLYEIIRYMHQRTSTAVENLLCQEEQIPIIIGVSLAPPDPKPDDDPTSVLRPTSESIPQGGLYNRLKLVKFLQTKTSFSSATLASVQSRLENHIKVRKVCLNEDPTTTFHVCDQYLAEALGTFRSASHGEKKYPSRRRRLITRLSSLRAATMP